MVGRSASSKYSPGVESQRLTIGSQASGSVRQAVVHCDEMCSVGTRGNYFHCHSCCPLYLTKNKNTQKLEKGNSETTASNEQAVWYLLWGLSIWEETDHIKTTQSVVFPSVPSVLPIRQEKDRRKLSSISCYLMGRWNIPCRTDETKSLCDRLQQCSWIILCMRPANWEMMLHCNVISHWLSTFTKWSCAVPRKTLAAYH